MSPPLLAWEVTGTQHDCLPSSSSSILVPAIWKETRKYERGNTLSIRSLGPCYHLDCSHSSNTVWFQIRKLVALCSGVSHWPPSQDRTIGRLLRFRNSPTKLLQTRPFNQSPWSWQKAFRAPLDEPQCRGCQCSRPAGTSQQRMALGNERLTRQNLPSRWLWPNCESSAAQITNQDWHPNELSRLRSLAEHYNTS